MPTISEGWGDDLHDHLTDQHGATVVDGEGLHFAGSRLALWFEDSALGVDPMPIRIGNRIRFPIHRERRQRHEREQQFYNPHYTFPSEDAARAAMAHVQLMFSLVR